VIEGQEVTCDGGSLRVWRLEYSDCAAVTVLPFQTDSLQDLENEQQWQTKTTHIAVSKLRTYCGCVCVCGVCVVCVCGVCVWVCVVCVWVCVVCVCGVCVCGVCVCGVCVCVCVVCVCVCVCVVCVCVCVKYLWRSFKTITVGSVLFTCMYFALNFSAHTKIRSHIREISYLSLYFLFNFPHFPLHVVSRLTFNVHWLLHTPPHFPFTISTPSLHTILICNLYVSSRQVTLSGHTQWQLGLCKEERLFLYFGTIHSTPLTINKAKFVFMSKIIVYFFKNILVISDYINICRSKCTWLEIQVKCVKSYIVVHCWVY
jgi:hypothetical protein